MPETLQTRAYAKINLALSVGPPEPPTHPKPGFHEIASWMSAIDLYDDIRITPLAPGEPSRATISWAPDAPRPTPIDWPIDADLGVRAHRLLETTRGRSLPVHLEISKRIPVGAGLGGGSSDAASVLLALNSLFELDLSPDELTAAAMQLGSDVAFFTDAEADLGAPPRAAIVSGFGESIDRCDPSSADLVLFLPSFGCATGAVYRAFDEVIAERDRLRLLDWETDEIRRSALGRPKGRPPLGHRVNPERVQSLVTQAPDGDELFNDLAPAAFHAEPRLGEIVTTLSRLTRRSAHVTGSGSGVFIVTNRPEKTLEQARRAASEHDAVLLTRLV